MVLRVLDPSSPVYLTHFATIALGELAAAYRMLVTDYVTLMLFGQDSIGIG